MDSWKQLSLSKKIIFGLAIIIAASLAPELMFLVDVGGIELAFVYLAFYLKPTFEWLKVKKQVVKTELKIGVDIILNSALFRPKIFVLNTLYCCLLLLLTSSLILSSAFYFPALLVSGTYI